MVTLVILDGFGLSNKNFGNAIKSAGTPNLDKLKEKYFYSELKASGTDVGLPKGQMGNSEVGHLTLGTGRVVLQDLLKINKDIDDETFYKNERIIKALNHAKLNNSSLHLMGLVSDGGVHSHINHLIAIIRLAKQMDLKKVYIHAFLDGRDTPYNSAQKYLDMTQKELEGTDYKIASLSGRIYAMDREQRYERLEKAYDMLVNGDNFQNKTYAQVIKDSYASGVYDEFMVPTLIDKNGVISDNDSIVFFNYRTDRARELTFALTDKNFDKFKIKPLKNVLFSPFTEYSAEFRTLNVIYPPEKIEDNLAAIISKNGLKQYHIAETTKYAHVTFFFNGGIEKAYDGEERKLIESVDTQDYTSYPKMKAIEITENALDAIASAKYDFILVNYSNPDMIGHTGNFNATKEAISITEKSAYALALATIMAGGDCIITADHGNAEYMIDKDGNKVTSHTTNPVPVYIATENYPKIKIKKGKSISNIAPTVLKLLKLEIPKTMNEPLF